MEIQECFQNEGAGIMGGSKKGVGYTIESFSLLSNWRSKPPIVEAHFLIHPGKEHLGSRE